MTYEKVLKENFYQDSKPVLIQISFKTIERVYYEKDFDLAQMFEKQSIK